MSQSLLVLVLTSLVTLVEQALIRSTIVFVFAGMNNIKTTMTSIFLAVKLHN